MARTHMMAGWTLLATALSAQYERRPMSAAPAGRLVRRRRAQSRLARQRSSFPRSSTKTAP